MGYQHIKTARSNGIFRIVICRESKRNALNRETLTELHEVIKAGLNDPQVKGMILTGAGERAFVAGADIDELAGLTSEEGKNLAEDGQSKVFDLIHYADKPIIAAINGFALGGGLELAMACHLRVASHMAKMGLPEVGLGLIPGYGGTQRLTQLVGRGYAMEMILTGNTIHAEKALQIGLVNHVVPADEIMEKSEEILQDIFRRSSKAVAAAIRAINAGLDQGRAGFQAEMEEFALRFGTSDLEEGIAAFREKRPPSF